MMKLVFNILILVGLLGTSAKADQPYRFESGEKEVNYSYIYYGSGTAPTVASFFKATVIPELTLLQQNGFIIKDVKEIICNVAAGSSEDEGDFYKCSAKILYFGPKFLDNLR